MNAISSLLSAIIVVCGLAPFPLMASQEDQARASELARHTADYVHRKVHVLNNAKNGAQVNYLKWDGSIATTDRPVLILPGRGEMSVQWAETIHDFRKLHFVGNAYILDHRGQGLSGRLASDPAVGHVDKFEDYVDDVILMVETIKSESHGMSPYIIAHSMGAAILTLALLKRPDLTDKVALITPMFDINLGKFETFGERAAGVIIKLISLVRPTLAVGNPTDIVSVYNPKDVKTDDPVRALARWELLQKYHAYVPMKTLRWISEALSATRKILKYAHKVSAKVLIYGAEYDHVVEQAAMEELSCKMPDCELRILPGAYHAPHEGTNPNRYEMIKGIGSFFRGRDLTADECNNMLAFSWLTSRSL